MSKELIFVVDDEIHIQQLIKFNLEVDGYRIFTFESGEELMEEVKSTIPDLLILDLMLPGIDGLEVCRQLRQDTRTSNIPIMMLTAKSEEFDRVLGLELGADDYITKPFSVRELVARVKAIIRRIKKIVPAEEEYIKHGTISINSTRREVYNRDTLIELPFKEYELLKLLIFNKGKVLSRELLLEKIWGFDYCGESRTVDVHIRYLRQKIEDDDSNPVYIETVRGIGYKFNDKKETVAL